MNPSLKKQPMRSRSRIEARNDVAAMLNEFRRLEKHLQENPIQKNANKLTRFALSCNCSVYYSEILENYYLNMANSTKQPNKSVEILPNSVLHVFTECYLHGGHTRVVERWIQSSNIAESHSVVLLNQSDQKQIPAVLRNAVGERNGQLHQAPNKFSIADKANWLRILASAFEFVVLHHHNNDPVPLMAFGIAEFQRPVLVYNHAGHQFWIGRNATDLVLDLEHRQHEITQDKRGIKHCQIVSIPIDIMPEQAFPPRLKIRETLGFPQQAKLVVSMASGSKYAVVLNYNFPKMLNQLLQEDSNVIVAMVGVGADASEEWVELKKTFGDRIHLLGRLPHKEAITVMRACDLYLDSYPYNSYTSILDAVTLGNLPALSLRTEVGTPLFIEGSPAIVSSQEELISRALRLLNDKREREALKNDLLDRIGKEAYSNAFNHRISLALEAVKTIPKDPSRYLPIKVGISDFDILSNELLRYDQLSRMRVKELGPLAILLKTKCLFFIGIYLFNYTLYKKELHAGVWNMSCMGFRWSKGMGKLK